MLLRCFLRSGVFASRRPLYPDFVVTFTAELVSRILEQITNKYEDPVVESGFCGGAAKFDIAGIGVVYTRWLKRAHGPHTPTVGTRAESKAEVNGSRAETRKAVKRK